MEEGLAEGAALEILNDAVEQLDTGVHGLFVRAREGAAGEDAHAALEDIDAVHVEKGQAFLAKDDFVLEDGLLHEVLVRMAFMLAAAKGLGPTWTKGKLFSTLCNCSLQYAP